MTAHFSHLDLLESESIHIFREAAAQFRKPVLLYSIGKDSSVMLHLAMKAFWPSLPPFPLMHIATGWDFSDMIVHRDELTKALGLRLIVQSNSEAAQSGRTPFNTDSREWARLMLIDALKAGMDANGFDAAFGGGRRDEEKSRAKERIFSFRSASQRWDPRQQRPELWRLYNARKHPGESIRVFPLSNWTELDIWHYIQAEAIDIVPLYFSAPRPTFIHQGQLLMADDIDRVERVLGRKLDITERWVRFRTLGCFPLTGAVESRATTLSDVIQEMLLTATSEREGRLIDHDQAASMEKKKAEGYF